MKLQKRKATIITMMITFACIFQLHAVFEGRDEKLQDYSSVRNSVNIESYSEKAMANEGMNLGDYTKGSNNTIQTYDNGPISDSPLFVLLLGGLGCGSYILLKKRKLNKV